MKRALAPLAERTFDVLVIGGGIHGAAAARAAAARGLSTALIEREDFGHATSANSLKVIHGGLRYLQHGDLRKVREAVRARRAVLRRFPHLAEPLPCLLATRGLGVRGRPALAAALLLNDLLSADRNRGVASGCRLSRGRTIPREELFRLAPGLADPTASGGALWYDGIALDTERLVLELVLDAAAAGAVVANRVRAEGFLRRGSRVEGARARDEVGGEDLEIRARVTINAAGPWGGELDRPLAAGAYVPPHGKAVNIFLDRAVFGDTAVGIEEREAGRFFFFVPWRGGTMIGTLYLPHTGPPGAPALTLEELELMVDTVNCIHPAAAIRPEEIRFAHVGLLPLAPGGGAVGSQLLRRSRIVDAGRELGVAGLISVIGVKYTTGMTVGSRAVDLAARLLGRAAAPAQEPQPQAPPAAPAGIDAALAARLARVYGAAGGEIFRDIAADGDRARRITPEQETTAAEVLHALRREMALSLADLVLRRTPLGTCGHPGRAALETCAALAGSELGWDEARRAREIAAVEAHYRRLLGREAP